MTKPETFDEIDQELKDLAREYSQTPVGDPRRTKIENEISALCSRRQILQTLIDSDRRED